MGSLHAGSPVGTAVERLSPRRREILLLVAKGLTNDEIAGALSISPGTVRTHVTAVLNHLDVSNRTEAAALWSACEARPDVVERVLARPAIAVFPFRTEGTDPDLATIAAGFTTDLTALFARWSWFPVLTLPPGGVAPAPSTVALGASLGACFMVFGELRRVARSYRLQVSIDDAETGHRLWTERVEFTKRSLFGVQDELCATLVATAYPVLIAQTTAWVGRERGSGNLAAWQLAHEGLALHAARDARSNAHADARLSEALARDPGLVLAHFGRGLVAYDAVLNQWGAKVEALVTLATAAERCLDLAPHAAEGHYLLGRYHQARGELVRAAASLEAAVARNPSFAIAHALLAQVLEMTGRSDEALARMRHAVRLGPRSFVAGLATLHFVRGDYDDALTAAERALATNPRYPFARVLAAGSAWWLGRPEVGRAHLQAVREESPGFRADTFVATFGARISAVERLAQGLAALEAGTAPKALPGARTSRSNRRG